MAPKKKRAGKRREAFQAAGICMRRLFLAPFVALASIGVGVILALAMWSTTGFGIAIAVILLGVTVCPTLLELAGLGVAREAHVGFRRAFVLSLIGAVLAVSTMSIGMIWFREDRDLFLFAVSLIGRPLGVLRIYFTCTAAGALLTEKGEKDLPPRFALFWKLVAVSSGMSILEMLAASLSGADPLVTVLRWVGNLFGLAVSILGVILYHRAARSFQR